MMRYNPDIHKRRSIRLKGYNYSSLGDYFITICCVDRNPLFGEIVDNQMCLNENGVIARREWLKTLSCRKGVELGEFIIMPNHIHAIVSFTEEFQRINSEKGVCHTPLQSPSYTLGAIIRGYKSAVTSQLKEQLGERIWQRNYYEHIIRNEKSYEMIEDYIKNNPLTWENDRFFIKV
ncbi:hypothetical protein A4G18_08350 [Pasteurellaceae bacterium Pebbles2]|nr:hypothetical protein [Pasteurellaceae bacterium Pebbles2]